MLASSCRTRKANLLVQQATYLPVGVRAVPRSLFPLTLFTVSMSCTFASFANSPPPKKKKLLGPTFFVERARWFRSPDGCQRPPLWPLSVRRTLCEYSIDLFTSDLTFNIISVRVVAPAIDAWRSTTCARTTTAPRRLSRAAMRYVRLCCCFPLEDSLHGPSPSWCRPCLVADRHDA